MGGKSLLQLGNQIACLGIVGNDYLGDPRDGHVHTTGAVPVGAVLHLGVGTEIVSAEGTGIPVAVIVESRGPILGLTGGTTLHGTDPLTGTALGTGGLDSEIPLAEYVGIVRSGGLPLGNLLGGCLGGCLGDSLVGGLLDLPRLGLHGVRGVRDGHLVRTDGGLTSLPDPADAHTHGHGSGHQDARQEHQPAALGQPRAKASLDRRA